MSTESSADVKKAHKEKAEKQKVEKDDAPKKKSSSDVYVLPVVGVRVQSKLVNAGFWGGLMGATVLGIVDPPLALFLGAGVVIARHKTKK